MTKSHKPTKTMTPWFLRHHTDVREPDWVQTPDGPLLAPIKRRIDEIYIRGGDTSALTAECLTMMAYAARVSRDHREKPITATVAPPPPPPATPPVQFAPAPEPTDTELLKGALQRYVATGDLSEIVPTGAFASDEEKTFWRRVVMGEVRAIFGRTVEGVKMSNSKPLDSVMLMPGISGALGKCAIINNGKLIVGMVPLGPRADVLSAQFNSLYRG